MSVQNKYVSSKWERYTMNRSKKSLAAALALALVLALAAGMVPLTAAASGFTDDDDIAYKSRSKCSRG